MIRIDFIDDFLEHREALPYIVGLENAFTELKEELRWEKNPGSRAGGYLLSDLPGYFRLETPSDIRTVSIDSYKGSYIRLSDYRDFDEYYRRKVSSKRRATLKSHERRLRHCLQVRHEIFFGSISKADYDALFAAFREMLERRFDQKQAYNSDLRNWERYRESFYPLILKKQACISVLWHEDQPISFSVNLVHSQVIYGYLKSFDTDYSRFSLGFLEFNLLLKWAFDNGIKLFDLLKGQYEYKNKLTDGVYYFKRTVIFPKKSLPGVLRAWFTAMQIKTVYAAVRFLKRFGVHVVVHKFISYKEKILSRSTSNRHRESYVIRPVEQDWKPADLLPADLLPADHLPVESLHTDHRFLRKPVLEFLFRNKEKFREVTISRMNDEGRNFLIKGEKSSAIITFN